MCAVDDEAVTRGNPTMEMGNVMAEELRFVEVSDAADSHWSEMLPVLAQLREGLNREGLESVLTSPVGQPPRFTGAFIDDACVSVAGWRLLANTHLGLVLYVDDLVVDGSHRGQGYGHAMLDEMLRIASSLGARAIDLDSGVQRSEAHRFYFANGYSISSHHFRRMIAEGV